MELLFQNQIDAYVIFGETDRFYFTGIHTSFGCVILSPTKKVFISDFRYQLAVEEKLCEGWTLCFIKFSELYETIRDQLKTIGGSLLGVEDEQISHSQYLCLKDALSDYEFVSSESALRAMRAVKTDDEIDHIRISQSINETALQATLNAMKPKMTERDLYAEFSYQLITAGSEGFAFDPIIAIGENSAKPHHEPSARRLDKGDVVLFDTGAKYSGYCSDMSRTVCLSEPREELRRIYTHVLKAQQYALSKIRAGITCGEADSYAREYLKANGFSKEFGHTLGHGVGLDIHEFPRVGAQDETILLENMVITVEPGVYIPGVGGVRIEDLVVVKADGILNLTAFHKNLEI